MSPRRFLFLDGLRGMAAMFVVARHTSIFWQGGVYRSYLAVDLFFILSGFVLTEAYGGRLGTGSLTFPTFMVLRWIRLYPIYAASVILSTLIALARIQFGAMGPVENGASLLGMLVSSLLFLPFPGESRLFPSVLFPLNPVYWSLFFELVVNVLYAAGYRRLGTVALLWIVAASALGVLACGSRLAGWELGMSWSKSSVIGGLFRTVLGFSIGVLVHRIRSGSSTVLPPSLLCGLLVIPALAFCIPNQGTWNLMVDLATVLMVFPAVVYGASLEAPNFSSPLLTLLGATSYPIYVFHKPVGDVLFHWFPGLVFRNAPWSGFVLLLILIAGAVMLLRMWDVPIRRRWMRWFKFELPKG